MKNDAKKLSKTSQDRISIPFKTIKWAKKKKLIIYHEMSRWWLNEWMNFEHKYFEVYDNINIQDLPTGNFISIQYNN